MINSVELVYRTGEFTRRRRGLTSLLLYGVGIASLVAYVGIALRDESQKTATEALDFATAAVSESQRLALLDQLKSSSGVNLKNFIGTNRVLVRMND